MKLLRTLTIAWLIVLGFAVGSAHAAGPVVVAQSPTNSAVGVAPDADLVLTFDRTIVTNTGTITVTNITDGTGVSIPVGDTQVSVSTSNLTISPYPVLELGDTYAVLIDSGTVTDTNGVDFVGISNTTDWRFTTTTDGNWALVAYWPLNDGTNGESVTTASEIINDPVYPASDGTISGSGGTWVYDTDRSRIVYSTTDNDLLRAGNMSIKQDFTWQAWIKTTDGSTIMGTRDNTYFRFTPGNLNGSWVNFDFAPDANDGAWHHMVCRRQGSTITVWLDGSKLSGSVTKSGTLSNTFQIAGTTRYFEALNGRMYDVAIWDEALTAARIQQLADGLNVIMDITPPVVSNFLPADGATGVGVGDNLVVTFDDVIVTNSGNIVLTNLTKSTGIVITVPGSDPDGMILASGSNLTINPTANLDPSDSYAVLMEDGTIANEYGYAFAGITSTGTWHFMTGAADTTPPSLSTLNPTQGATGWPVASNLVATFNENIVLANGGIITITNLTTGAATNITAPDAQLSFLNTQLTIDPAIDLEYGNLYAVLIGATAVEDTSGNPFAGISDSTTWRFTTDTRPVAVAFDPNNGAVDVITSTNLSITFDKDMAAIAGGVIRIRNLTDATEKVLVLQDDLPLIPGTQDDRLTITGSNVSINARSRLEYGDLYAVQIGTNAFKDLFGQGFLGITNDTTWSFTTDPDPNANLTAYWPLTDGADGETVASTGGADDIIDDPLHGATDATETGSGNSWVYDAERDSIVLRTVNGGRLNAGKTQMNMDFTWSCWAKGIGGEAGPLMGTRSGSYMRLYLTNINGSYLNLEFPDFNDDAWHHLAVTRKDNLFTVYVDGTFQASKTSAAGDNNMTFEIGGTGSFSEDFNGYMSDVAIWLEALTVSRIQDLASGKRAIYKPSGAVIIVR